jgi:predicted O-linked N-acetylglucosamine transferase (SPINDLY family)
MSSELLQQAASLHRQGHLAEAETLYRKVLEAEPSQFDALHLYGYLQHQLGRHDTALAWISRALAVNPDVSPAHSNLGLVLRALGRLDDALAAQDRALQLAPGNVEAHTNRAAVLLDMERPEDALASLDRALSLRPDDATALLNRGNALRDLNRHIEALAEYGRAIARKPDFADAYVNRGNVQLALNRHRDALADYDRALQCAPEHGNALFNRARVLLLLDRPAEALDCYNRALRKKGEDAELLVNRANAWLALKRPENALADNDRALQLQPGRLNAINNRGIALLALDRPAEALAEFERALERNPRYVHALSNRGSALLDLDRPEEALDCFARAAELKPDDAVTANNLAQAFDRLKRYDDAARAYARLLRLSPDYAYADGFQFHARLKACDWSDYYAAKLRLATAAARGEKRDPPFSFLAHAQSAADQLACARTYAADKYPADPAPVWSGRRYEHGKIRLAYLSADFHGHATAYLIAELFELHDRARFELTAVSYGPIGDTAYERLKRPFDRFLDVRGSSDRRIAGLLAEHEIDIAVDLKGYTGGGRPGIFTHRGAPLQVNYLGYPGTMGALYFDYLIADTAIVPPELEGFYSEKIVRLPDSYQVNDRKRPIAERTPSRAELGLPENGFVFCCFNNNYKIAPFVFDVWMRLLKRVEGSVLWLLADNADAARNLKREAEARGIPAARLVFAPRAPLAEHLARHRAADLFLDTLPCNAHTTTSDALWAGLPLVTSMGETFASRVAGSLLHAAGLPELIAPNMESYEALAFRLATEPDALAAIGAKLARNRDTCPLFDTDRYRRHLEAAFAAMHERQMRGEAPASFDVTPSA